MDSVFIYIQPIPVPGGPSEGLWGPLCLGVLLLCGIAWILRKMIWRFSGCCKLGLAELETVKALLDKKREGGRK